MDVHQAFPDARVTDLVNAIGRRDYSEADRAIKAGADVNTIGTDGISPLLWVFGTHDARGMEYLLKAGADPNYRDAKRHESVISIAAGGNRLDLLEILLKHGANPNLIGPSDEPPLHIAVEQFRKQNIDLLLKYGADINISWGPNSTAAQTAAGLGRFDLTAYLLERGLNANLDGLALTVQLSHVPPHSDAQRWKNKVIDMLKARGVTYPVPLPARKS